MSGVGLGFQDSSSLETALLPAWPRAERQCARRARRKVAAQGGDSRPQATSRVPAAESPRLASPRPRPAPLSSSSAASAPQARRSSAHPARGGGRLTYNPRVGPSRSTKATLKVFSNQRRLRLRDLAPRRACAPVAAQRECARRRASDPTRRCPRRACPPTVRLRVRVRRRLQQAGDRRGVWKWPKGLEDLSCARRRRSRENVPKPWLLIPERSAGRAPAENRGGFCRRELQARVSLPDLPPSGG